MILRPQKAYCCSELSCGMSYVKSDARAAQQMFSRMQKIFLSTFVKMRIHRKPSGSAMAEGPRDALISRNSATTKYPYRMALFA